MAGGKKEQKGPATRPVNLKELTRQVLAENGELPDRWIIAAKEEPGQTRLFCTAPPFAITEETHGPLLDFALLESLNLSVLLTEDKGEVETIACASYGFLGNLLCEKDFDDEDFPPGFVELSRVRRRAPLDVMLRTALQEMIHLGYSRLNSNQQSAVSQQFSQSKSQNHLSSHGEKSKIELLVRPDGGMAIKRFDPDVTLGHLSEAMGGLAPKAKLTRLRQTAQNCGGCGRCCHDPDIPLTYFDVRSVAAHRFPDLYGRNPAAALAQTQQMLGFPYQPPVHSLLPADRLFFRKKDGSGGANSPCIFLDGRGLCGVYLGRPLLCRMYHCAVNSQALELLYRTAFYTVEWLGRAVESGLLRPAKPITLPQLLEIPVIQIASPYALSKVLEEVKDSPKLAPTKENAKKFPSAR